MGENEILIMFDKNLGPIWKPKINDKKDIVTGISVVDNDELVHKFNDQLANIYEKCYKISDKIDKKLLHIFKSSIINLLDKLVSRLNEINDGTYCVNNLALKFINNL